MLDFDADLRSDFDGDLRSNLNADFGADFDAACDLDGGRRSGEVIGGHRRSGVCFEILELSITFANRFRRRFRRRFPRRFRCRFRRRFTIRFGRRLSIRFWSRVAIRFWSRCYADFGADFKQWSAFFRVCWLKLAMVTTNISCRGSQGSASKF